MQLLLLSYWYLYCNCNRFSKQCTDDSVWPISMFLFHHLKNKIKLWTTDMEACKPRNRAPKHQSYNFNASQILGTVSQYKRSVVYTAKSKRCSDFWKTDFQAFLLSEIDDLLLDSTKENLVTFELFIYLKIYVYTAHVCRKRCLKFILINFTTW